MTGILISVSIFLAVFLGIFAINLVLTDIFKQERSEQLKAMEAELRTQMRQHARSTAQQDDMVIASMEVSSTHHAFSVMDMIKKFRRLVGQAGLNSDPQKIGFFGMAAGAAAGVGLYFLTNSVLVALAVMALGTICPVFYILFKRKKRLEELGDQLPEVLDLMARVMRAGQTVPQALNAVADEFKDPIGTEFGFCYEQQNLGLSLELAMRNLVERTGLMEIKILVMAMLIQRQAGGNLAELLDKLADVMRQRQELKGTVRALTAEGRLQASFLVFLPFFAWIAMFFLNREYAVKLLQHPTLIYSTLGLMFVGMVWIRKIVNFDY
ncbi:MAG: type II secretion system F family protein [Pirellulaceae bacterium]